MVIPNNVQWNDPYALWFTFLEPKLNVKKERETDGRASLEHLIPPLAGIGGATEI